MRQLPRVVAETAPGTKVEVELMRKGKHKTVSVKVAELKEEKPEQHAAAKGEESKGSTSFGFDIADVPPELAQRLGLGHDEGAAVVRVYPGGPAERAGLRPSDVIVEVDGSAVKGGMDAEQKLRKADERTLLPDGSWRLELLRRHPPEGKMNKRGQSSICAPSSTTRFGGIRK